MPSSNCKTTAIRTKDEVAHRVSSGVLSVPINSPVLNFDHTLPTSKPLDLHKRFLYLTAIEDDPNIEAMFPRKSFRVPSNSQGNWDAFNESSLNLDPMIYVWNEEDLMERGIANEKSEKPAPKSLRGGDSPDTSRLNSAMEAIDYTLEESENDVIVESCSGGGPLFQEDLYYMDSAKYDYILKGGWEGVEINLIDGGGDYMLD